MSDLHGNEKTVVAPQTETAVLPVNEKGEQIHSVTESAENTESQQQGRMAKMFTYMKTRDFWIVIILGCVLVVGPSCTLR